MASLMAVVLMASLITSMQVYYDKDVTVVVHYQLDGAQKLGSILFGLNNSIVKNEILSIFSSNDYTIVKMDFEKAILKFNTSNRNGYYFFPGIKLENYVNMTLVLPNNVTLNITSNEIPQAYIFT
jgi:hypothetical protein